MLVTVDYLVCNFKGSNVKEMDCELYSLSNNWNGHLEMYKGEGCREYLWFTDLSRRVMMQACITMNSQLGGPRFYKVGVM